MDFLFLMKKADSVFSTILETKVEISTAIRHTGWNEEFRKSRKIRIQCWIESIKVDTDTVKQRNETWLLILSSSLIGC